MCGRYYIAEDDAAEELRQIIEAVNRRNPDAKTGGEIRPGDTVPVLANSPASNPARMPCTGAIHCPTVSSFSTPAAKPLQKRQSSKTA